MLTRRDNSNIYNNNNTNKTTCSPHTNICPPRNNNNLHLHDIINGNLTNSKTIDLTKKSNDKCRT